MTAKDNRHTAILPSLSATVTSRVCFTIYIFVIWNKNQCISNYKLITVWKALVSSCHEYEHAPIRRAHFETLKLYLNKYWYSKKPICRCVKRWTEGTSAFGRCSASISTKNGSGQLLSAIRLNSSHGRKPQFPLHRPLFVFLFGGRDVWTTAEVGPGVKNIRGLKTYICVFVYAYINLFTYMCVYIHTQTSFTVNLPVQLEMHWQVVGQCKEEPVTW